VKFTDKCKVLLLIDYGMLLTDQARKRNKIQSDFWIMLDRYVM